MRILILGSAHPWRMERGIQRALERAGHRTLLLDDRRLQHRLGHRLVQRWVRARARRFAPDFVILSKCLALDLETVETVTRGRGNVMWYHDPQWYRHTTTRPDIGHISAVARLADLLFVTGYAEQWRRLGLRARFLPACGDRGIVPVARDPEFVSDVAFIGSGWAPERAEFLAQVGARLRLRVWGPGWERWRDALRWTGRTVEGRDFAAVCSSSAITLGVNPGLADDATTYVSDRMWMTILGGGFYMGKRTPGIDRMLLDGVHCAFYDDLDSLVAGARYYLSNPWERERVRRAGEAFVREHHTFDQRIANLLSGREWENPLGWAPRPAQPLAS